MKGAKMPEKLVPPAGVEPATYRLGGESSNQPQYVDPVDISVASRPISGAVHQGSKALISQDVDFRFGRDSELSPAILEHLHELKIVHDLAHPDRQIPPFDAAGRDILDIGCGIGQTLTAPEFAAARSHHGVDVNAEAIAKGLEMFPHLSLRHALAESLPYDDESFDMVYARVAIPYTDIPRALAEARRVLRPGGQLWISLHGWSMELRQIKQARSVKKWLFRAYVWCNSLLFNTIGRTFKHPLHKRTTSIQTRGGITRALQRAGFHGVEIAKEGPHFSARASRVELWQTHTDPAVKIGFPINYTETDR